MTGKQALKQLKIMADEVNYSESNKVTYDKELYNYWISIIYEDLEILELIYKNFKNGHIQINIMEGADIELINELKDFLYT